jgi:uncharacterized membrane protein
MIVDDIKNPAISDSGADVADAATATVVASAAAAAMPDAAGTASSNIADVDDAESGVAALRRNPVPTPASSSPLTPFAPALAGRRHSATWNYAVMLAFSLIALLVSLILSAETLQLARNPKKLLDCDVNSVLSCSTVAESWQSEIVKFNGLSYPNAFFGIAAESVFITIAVIGLARIRVPRWFAVATWFGGLAALLYAYWLFTQSVFVIQALCPWCLVLMFSTTIQFMALFHATVSVQHLPDRAGLKTYYRLNYDLMVDAVWILFLIAIIIVKDGPALFG